MKYKILSAILLMALPVLASDLDYAFRLPAELQVTEAQALVDLTWQQGTTPLIQVEVLRRGRPVDADTNTTVRMIIGPSATNLYFVPVTNTASLTTNTSYYVQWPTVGTNTAGAAWWYTIYFERDGRRYWTGNGDLYIEETTSTAEDGLTWQTITTGLISWGNVIGTLTDQADLVLALDAKISGLSVVTGAVAGVTTNDGILDLIVPISVGPQGEQGIQGTQGIQGVTGETGLTGDQGIQGTQGIQGVQGEIGLTGDQGIQGTQGIQGATGSIGETGATGTQGIQGVQGDIGLTGETGPQGTQGIQGVEGPAGTNGVDGIDGTNGVDGAQGLPGTNGIDGVNGIDGTNGIDGATGPQGTQGIQGVTGEVGPQGTQGIQGVQGDIGLTGETGPQGTQGIQGVQGEIGPQGTQGIQGVQGEIGPAGTNGVDGVDGTNGLDGATGPAGTNGIDGVDGAQGPPGTNGVDGINGIDGTNGVDGIQGPPGTNGVDGIDGTNGVDGADGLIGAVTFDQSGSNNAYLYGSGNTNLQITFDTNYVRPDDSRLSDSRDPKAHTQDWSTITGTPDSVSGYGITDAYTKVESDAAYATTGTVGDISADVNTLDTDFSSHTNNESADIQHLTAAEKAHAAAAITNETDPVWESEKSGYATGTPVYVESDPVWVADKAGYYTQVESDGLYATGTPIYVEADPVWEAEKSGYATGTPLYVYSETDPVWESEKGGYATGTPLYVESYVGTITGGTVTAGSNNTFVVTGPNAAVTWNTNAGAGSGSGFPLDADGDLAGYSLTNGFFVGDGDGLTNLTSYVETNATDYTGLLTNLLAFHAESNIYQRVDGTNIYYGESVTIAAGTTAGTYYDGANGASVSGQVAVLTTNKASVESYKATSNIVTELNTNAVRLTDAAYTNTAALAAAALPKAGGTMTGEILYGTNRFYLGTATNAPWFMGLGTTNIMFGAGTNRAIFGSPW